MRPWIGVDLDGTLAEQHSGGDPEDIGAIVEPMKQRILDWLEEDFADIKIFTARVAENHKTLEPRVAKTIIQNWLEKNGLPKLEVTNIKDFNMLELYDDRAVQVEFNTGKLFGESTMQHRQLLKK